jgi:RNA polymerase sigma factor for flagellar operon FliA
VGDKADLHARALAECGEMVDRLARRLHRSLGSRVDLDELRQIGMVGLLEASERWDPSLGASFSGYVYFRVQGRMLDSLGKLTGVSRSNLRAARRIAAGLSYQESLSDVPGPQASMQAASDYLQEAIRGAVSVGDFVVVMEQSAAEDSLDGEFGDRPSASLERADVREAVTSVLDTLDPQEAWLLRAHYLQSRTLVELAEEFGVSRSWMCRLHLRALRNARARLEARGLDSASFFGATS